MAVDGNAFEVAPLEGNPPFGAQVFGLRQESLADESVRAALSALWKEKGVLVFRNAPGADFQIALSQCFGELIPHPTKEAQSTRPELSVGHFKPEDGMIYEVEGDLRGNWLPWHTDLLYKPWINRGGMLRVVKSPSRLGLTGYIDKSASYRTLPDDLKAKIENLGVVYKFNFDFENQPFVTHKIRTLQVAEAVKSIHARSMDFPEVVHPMVFTHRDLGVKCLNVSPSNALGIYGMQNAEGDALLREVLAYATNEDLAYYHAWQPDDLVQWDNWRVIHCATGGPADEERRIERTTIAGDYGFGRYADPGQQARETASLDG